MVLAYGLDALRRAGRRRQGRPTSAQPALPAHVQPKPRVVEAPKQAARRAEAATPPEAHRAGGIPSPRQAFANGRLADTRGACGQVSVAEQEAVAPTAAPAWVQPLPAQPGSQRSYRPPSMEAWLLTQGQGEGGQDQEWLAPARTDDHYAPDQAPWGRPPPSDFAAPPSDWAPARAAEQLAPDQAPWGRPPPPRFAAAPSDDAPTAIPGWAHTQGEGQGPEPQHDPPSFAFPHAAPTARLGRTTPYHPNLGPVPGPEGGDAEGVLAHMAALLPGFGAAPAPLPLRPDQASRWGNGGHYSPPGFYGATRRTTTDSDASPKIAAWQGDAGTEEAFKPESTALHMSTAAPRQHLPAPIRLLEDAGADAGAQNGVRLASPIMLPDDEAEGSTTAGADALPPRFRGRIQGFLEARADTADSAWGQPEGGAAGGEAFQGSQLGFETWGAEVSGASGRRAAPLRQYRPQLVLGRMASRAMAAAASERQMDRAARR